MDITKLRNKMIKGLTILLGKTCLRTSIYQNSYIAAQMQTMAMTKQSLEYTLELMLSLTSITSLEIYFLFDYNGTQFLL